MSDNVRHSAVKSLYAEGFVGYYRVRHLKETSQNRLLLTPEKSLTMKQYHSSTNNSDGIISVSFSVRPPLILRSSSVQAPFELRSSSVQAPFNLRSSSVRAPFELRSSSVRAPFSSRSLFVRFSIVLRSVLDRFSFILRSSSVHSPFGNRRLIEERTENHRRQDGDVSKL